MTYLTIPPWPWLPTPPMSEGSYLFVNKNVVEMLALCVLATTYTGRWFGVDGLIYVAGAAHWQAAGDVAASGLACLLGSSSQPGRLWLRKLTTGPVVAKNKIQRTRLHDKQNNPNWRYFPWPST